MDMAPSALNPNRGIVTDISYGRQSVEIVECGICAEAMHSYGCLLHGKREPGDAKRKDEQQNDSSK